MVTTAKAANSYIIKLSKNVEDTARQQRRVSCGAEKT